MTMDCSLKPSGQPDSWSWGCEEKLRRAASACKGRRS